MFENVRIRTLLASGFGIIIALIAAMAVITFQKSSIVARDVADIANDSYPKVTAAAGIRFNVMRNWANTLLLLQVTDNGEAKRISEEMTANSKAITEHFDYLEKSIQSEKGKQVLASALKARKEYTDNRKQYLEMIKAGNKEEANRFLVSTLKTNIDAYTSAIGNVITYQSERMTNDTAESREHTNALQMTTIIISLLIVAVSVATAVIVIRTISGALGGSLRYAKEVAHEIAGGNLAVNVKTEPGDDRSLLASIKLMRDNLREMIQNIDTSAGQLGEAARQLVQSANAVAAASAQQSEATSATAAAVEEMTVGIDHIAHNAGDALSFSEQSATLSQKGTEVIHEAAAEMGKIAASVDASSAIMGTLEQQSSEISAVVNVIKDIADQTNLLALNAAIEAARAGEQGRGFAVVADEVRKLAERTTSSTQEIAATIDKIQGGTRNAVQSMVSGVEQVRAGTTLARQAGDSIGEIQSSTERVVGAVNDISGSLREQSIASTEIARNIENIARMVEENSASAEKSAVAAHQLERLADGLSTSVRSFRL